MITSPCSNMITSPLTFVSSSLATLRRSEISTLARKSLRRGEKNCCNVQGKDISKERTKSIYLNTKACRNSMIATQSLYYLSFIRQTSVTSSRRLFLVPSHPCFFRSYPTLTFQRRHSSLHYFIDQQKICRNHSANKNENIVSK